MITVACFVLFLHRCGIELL